MCTLLCELKSGRTESYRAATTTAVNQPDATKIASESVAVVRNDQEAKECKKKKTCKRKGKDDLNELKKEVSMDEHKIPLQELVQRLETDTCKVSF